VEPCEIEPATARQARSLQASRHRRALKKARWREQRDADVPPPTPKTAATGGSPIILSSVRIVGKVETGG
jgi:hypothetical protein